MPKAKKNATKSAPPSAGHRRNLYWPPERDARLLTIARWLTAKGIPGMLDSKGRLNRSALVEHLIDDKLAQIEAE